MHKSVRHSLAICTGNIESTSLFSRCSLFISPEGRSVSLQPYFPRKPPEIARKTAFPENGNTWRLRSAVVSQQQKVCFVIFRTCVCACWFCRRIWFVPILNSFRLVTSKRCLNLDGFSERFFCPR